MNNLSFADAKTAVKNGEFTCVLCGGRTFTSKKRGVLPLVELIDDNADTNGCFAADKIVGRAAAFLYVILNVKHVYACVMSNGAKKLLESYGISTECDECVDLIINRAGTGLCPMETAVSGVDDNNTSLALDLIKNKIIELKANKM